MKRLEKKHPLAIRWFHWVNFPVLMVMIWSGILIYWANDVYRIGFGEITAWHFLFMWFFVITGQRRRSGTANSCEVVASPSVSILVLSKQERVGSS